MVLKDPAPDAGTRSDDPDGEVSATAQDNLEAIANLSEKEDAHVGPLRAFIEYVGSIFSRPGYFVFVIAFIVGWILVNVWGRRHGWAHVDEPPFFWLQGIVSSNALLLTISVLIRQDRMAHLASHRAHLDLQINMLTERKVAKALELIAQLDEHRRPHHDEDRHLAELSTPTDAEALMQAIKRNADPVT